MLPLLFALIAPASAAPQTLTQSGHLLDALGAPVTGSHSLNVRLLDASGVELWAEPHTVVFDGGYYALVLGTGVALPTALFQDDVTVVLEVDGTELGREALAATPYALAVDGVVKAGDVTRCGATDAGTLRWHTQRLEVCNGAAWQSVSVTRDGASQATATPSCAQLHSDLPALGSGAYWVDPDGGAGNNALPLWCDMANDDGGWTLVAAIQNGVAPPSGTGATNAALLGSSETPVGAAKLADADIALLGHEFRHTISAHSAYNRWYLLSHPLALSGTGNVRSGDQCKAAYASAYQPIAFTPASLIIGLGSASDGCGTCSDACGGGGSTGSWWAWTNNAPSTGSYSQATAYSNAWIYVR